MMRRVAVGIAIGAILIVVGAVRLEDVAQVVALCVGTFIVVFAVVSAIESERYGGGERAGKKDDAEPDWDRRRPG
jgi:hypothetical protein